MPPPDRWVTRGNDSRAEHWHLGRANPTYGAPLVQLTLTRLTTGYAGAPVITGLSLQITAGETVMLTGPNGSGKTTLLRTLAGFIAPDTGSIVLDGGDPEQTVGQQAHLVGHLNAIKPRLTVQQNLTDWSRILGGTAGDVDAALAAFHLEELAALPVGYLSAGQKRRTALARLLTARRPLWLLDEPTTALDTGNAALVSSIIAAHARSGGIVIAATHLPIGIAGARSLDLAAHATREATA